MTISGLQKLTLLDFPGKTACIVFTRDCNFRCPFCHNAALVTEKEGETLSEGEVLAYLEKRKNLLDGVSITGGEPLLQKDIAGFIRAVKALGYAVKLDTNGTFPERLAPLLSEGLLDYVAMDIKNGRSGYAAAAGLPVDIGRIEKSVGLITASGVDYEFRTTLVKGIHDEASFREAMELIRGAKRFFLQKFVDSGNLIDGRGLSAFSRAETERFAAIAREYVEEVALRGMD